MKTYTVTLAHCDAWNEQTLVVEAASVEERVPRRSTSPMRDASIAISSAPRIRALPSSPESPKAETSKTTMDLILSTMSSADRSCSSIPSKAAFGAGTLLAALEAALPELESELDQR